MSPDSQFGSPSSTCLSSLIIKVFFQHYLDLDMSKYEGHLYTNVEELDAAMDHVQSLDTHGPSEEINTMSAEYQDSKL